MLKEAWQLDFKKKKEKRKKRQIVKRGDLFLLFFHSPSGITTVALHHTLIRFRTFGSQEEGPSCCEWRSKYTPSEHEAGDHGPGVGVNGRPALVMFFFHMLALHQREYDLKIKPFFFTMWTLAKNNYFTWKNTNLRNASVYHKIGMTHLGTRSYCSRVLIFSYIFHHS